MDDPTVRRHDTDEVVPTVVVVKDEPVIREPMAVIREDEGYPARQAVDGLQALELMEQHGINLMLSDVRRCRASMARPWSTAPARGDAIPVVLISAVSTEVDLPGVRYLWKPFDCEHLLTIIAAALQETGRSTRGGTLGDRTGPVPTWN